MVIRVRVRVRGRGRVRFRGRVRVDSLDAVGHPRERRVLAKFTRGTPRVRVRVGVRVGVRVDHPIPR